MYIWPAKKKKKTDRENKFSSIIKFADYYSEADFFKKISAFGVKIGVEILFYALILFYVLTDEKVSFKNKMVIMGALGYFILPTDFIADFIPVLGFSDDAAFLTFALMSISKSITPEIKEKAKKKIKELIDENIDPETITFLTDKVKEEKKS